MRDSEVKRSQGTPGGGRRAQPRGARVRELLNPLDSPEAPLLVLCHSETEAAHVQSVIRRDHSGVPLAIISSPGEWRSALERNGASLVIAEHYPAEIDAFDILESAQKIHPGLPFIILLDTESEQEEEALFHAGATDVVLKSGLWRLRGAIERALAENNLRCTLERTRRDLEDCNLELESRARNRSLEFLLKNEMIEEEERLSEKIHELLLPKEIPPITVPAGTQHYRTLRFASLYRPARVLAGDFYHVNRVSESTVNVFLGDVMGHGTRATLVSAMLRLLYQNLAEDAFRPDQLLQRINQALCRVTQESETLVFATACALTLDLKNARLRFSCAGHPPPVLLPADGSLPIALGMTRKHRPALGIFPDARYSLHEEALGSNDKVLLVTDGVFDVESSAGQFVTPESLWREASNKAHLPLQGILDSLISFLENFSGTPSFPDDVCMLGIQIEPYPRRAA